MTKIVSARRENDNLAYPLSLHVALPIYVGNPFQMAGPGYESYGNAKRLCLPSISHPSESKIHKYLVSFNGIGLGRPKSTQLAEEKEVLANPKITAWLDGWLSGRPAR